MRHRCSISETLTLALTLAAQSCVTVPPASSLDSSVLDSSVVDATLDAVSRDTSIDRSIVDVSMLDLGGPNTCGNGVVNEGEMCDGQSFESGLRCESFGRVSGMLRCSDDCGSIETVNCTPPSTCTDGRVNESNSFPTLCDLLLGPNGPDLCAEGFKASCDDGCTVRCSPKILDCPGEADLFDKQIVCVVGGDNRTTALRAHQVNNSTILEKRSSDDTSWTPMQGIPQPSCVEGFGYRDSCVGTLNDN